MKKWTCCLLSAVLLICFSFYPQGGKTVTLSSSALDVSRNESTSFFEKALEKCIFFFMGIKNEEKDNTRVVIDLTGETESFTVEVERIKAEISTEKSEAVPKSAKHASKVLIYHTHTDEAYLKGDKDYVETSAGRTKNPEYSVISVGETLKTSLEKDGFTVVHDSTDNVRNGFNKAYQTSYETIKGYIGDADVFIDLHRDAYSGRKPNFVTQGSTEYAHVCFVVARGQNYTEKPRWQENYKLAQKINDRMNELCPGIAKGIIFKDKTRFNQHVSGSCLLIEMGNEQNTLEQVKASAEIVAAAMNDIIE